MAETSIPVDLLNPGQVFACLGLLELAENFFGDAQAAFGCCDAQDRFHLRVAGQECPVMAALKFLRGSSVSSRSPSCEDLSTKGWNVTTMQIDPNLDPFPFPVPDSPATLPTILSCGNRSIEISHWGDDFPSTGRDNVKFWAGAGGKPGAVLAQDALNLINAMPDYIASDPFNASARQSSIFRLDWRRDYIPLDIGFSLNAHNKDRLSLIHISIASPLVQIASMS